MNQSNFRTYIEHDEGVKFIIEIPWKKFQLKEGLEKSHAGTFFQNGNSEAEVEHRVRGARKIPRFNSDSRFNIPPPVTYRKIHSSVQVFVVAYPTQNSYCTFFRLRENSSRAKQEYRKKRIMQDMVASCQSAMKIDDATKVIFWTRLNTSFDSYPLYSNDCPSKNGPIGKKQDVKIIV